MQMSLFQEENHSPWHKWLENITVRLIKNEKDLKELLTVVYLTGKVAIDIETTGLDPVRDKICLIQMAAGDVKSPDDPCEVWIMKQANHLQEILKLIQNKHITKVFHNAKFDLSFFRAAAGRRIPMPKIFDTMIASQLTTAGDFIPEAQFESYLLEQGITKTKKGAVRYFDRHWHEILFQKDTQKQTRPVYISHSLQQIAHRHLEIWLKKEFQTADWSNAPDEEMLRYAARDAAVLLPLYEILKELLKRNQLIRVAQIEFDCIPAVIEIELAGMPFDKTKAEEMLQSLEQKEIQAGAQLKQYVENPNSSLQIQEAIEKTAAEENLLQGNEIVLKSEKFPITSSDEILSQIASRLPEESRLRGLIDSVQEYREAKKKADFLRQWLQYVHPATGRLHPDLQQLNPQGTGRFSAREPNLQQSPRNIEIRQLFASSNKLIISDYSGIEMRIMAQLARDENMIKAFQNGLDIHTYTASQISGKPMEEITKPERQAAKSCGFGLIYGINTHTLKTYAEVNYGVRMTLEEAKHAREKFFKAYPEIEKWHLQQRKEAFHFKDFHCHNAEKGFFTEKRPCVRTLTGRLRVWPTEMGKEKPKKVGPVTEMFNTPDQGSGADMMKLAMGYLYQELLARRWDDVKIIATVHDELILEAPEEKAQAAKELLESVMIQAGKEILPDVPVEVEAKIADSWAEK